MTKTRDLENMLRELQNKYNKVVEENEKIKQLLITRQTNFIRKEKRYNREKEELAKKLQIVSDLFER